MPNSTTEVARVGKGPWAVLKFVTPGGKPIPGVLVRVTTPDGHIHECESDVTGLILVKSSVPGECKIEYI